MSDWASICLWSGEGETEKQRGTDKGKQMKQKETK